LNRTIMADLARLAGEQGAEVLSAEAAGFDGDAMEAEAWAYLAVRSSKGLPLTFPGTTGVKSPVSGGALARPVLLETERLILTPWQRGDEASLAALHSTEETSLYVGEGVPWSLDYAKRRIDGWRSSFATRGLATLKVLTKNDGVFIGRAGINWYEEDGAHQVVYSIARHAWGQGYATEIAASLRDWFFAQDIADRLEGMAHVDNTASIRVLTTIGMTPTVLRQVRGEPCQFFEIDRASWELAKASPSRNPTS
jgi:anhydro-N-acetylmuramic acid kinase